METDRRFKQSITLARWFSAFAVDMALILYIEITREAVEQLSGGVHPLLWFHVRVAVVLAHIRMILLGRRMLRREESVRGVHRKLALTLLCAPYRKLWYQFHDINHFQGLSHGPGEALTSTIKGENR